MQCLSLVKLTIIHVEAAVGVARQWPKRRLILSYLVHVSWLVFKHYGQLKKQFYLSLSYDVASGSEITLCNKICKPLVVYRFSGNVMTSITTLRVHNAKIITFLRQK